MKTICFLLFSLLLISSTVFAKGIPALNNDFHVIKTSPAARDMFGYFRVHRQGIGVTLNWGMSSMAGVGYFIIERSYDGEYFDPISQVPKNGSNRQSWRDLSVFPGYIHYRIICVMNDGTELSSEVKTVRIVQHG